jgi:hypothetical protein
MSESKYTYGSFSFENIGPGYVAFRLEASANQFVYFLQELGLIRNIPGAKRWDIKWEFIPEFKEFLTEQGYNNIPEIFKALKTTGLIMKNDRAISFRLTFL